MSVYVVPSSQHTLQSSNIYLLLDKSLDLNTVTYKQAKRRVFLQEKKVFLKTLPFRCKSHFSEAAEGDSLEELAQMRFNGMESSIMENTKKHNGAKTDV